MPFRLPYECQNSIVLIFKDNKLERKEIFLHRWQISKMYLSQILTKMYRTYKIKAIIYKENIKQDRSKWSSRHYYSWMGRFNTIIISVFLILICASNAHISEHSVSKRRYEKMKSSASLGEWRRLGRKMKMNLISGMLSLKCLWDI